MLKSNIFLAFTLFMLLTSSCSLKQQVIKDLKSPDNHNYFSGLLVYNPETGKNLIDHQSQKYFTPASTVKLFTLYTALEVLGDSIATISYFESPDTLYIKPLADPSFLHDSLPNKTYDFLISQEKPIAILKEKFQDFIYGDGWQWDDYPFYYMPEKSVFPLYGNVAILQNNSITPSFFQKNLQETDSTDYHRNFYTNNFYFDPDRPSRYRKIPFKTSLELSTQLLKDTLGKPVNISQKNIQQTFKPYISTPTNALYERLMNESENFMAEQLFLIISKNKTNSYQVKNTIDWALDSLFYDIPQKPRWVDASGLSRYNLFTPASMVYLLDKLYRKHGKDQVKKILPSNGKTKALQKWYPYEKTYLYAKTGSVSNNHNICGYIETKKGKFLIFSFMNNNYMESSAEVRNKMNHILQEIYLHY